MYILTERYIYAEYRTDHTGNRQCYCYRCYNTCFALKRDNEILLVDAGGGNGILSQLEKAKIPLSAIHEIFVTHAHTDHILGVIWMIRMIAQQMNKGEYNGILKVYGHDKVMEV